MLPLGEGKGTDPLCVGNVSFKEESSLALGSYTWKNKQSFMLCVHTVCRNKVAEMERSSFERFLHQVVSSSTSQTFALQRNRFAGRVDPRRWHIAAGQCHQAMPRATLPIPSTRGCSHQVLPGRGTTHHPADGGGCD